MSLVTRAIGLGVLVGCTSHDALVVTSSFPVTVFTGSNPSPLDPLQDQTIDFAIDWPAIDHNHGDTPDPPGCKTTAIGFLPATRTAHGAAAATVQQEILDPLGDWDLKLQICDPGAGRSSVTLESVIDRLNLTFGCFGLPPAATIVRGSDGYPQITSFTASACSATILDVDHNRVVGNDSFSITVDTGGASLP